MTSVENEAWWIRKLSSTWSVLLEGQSACGRALMGKQPFFQFFAQFGAFSALNKKVYGFLYI